MSKPPTGKLKDLQRPIRYSLFQRRRSKVQLLTCAEGHDQTTEEKGEKKITQKGKNKTKFLNNYRVHTKNCNYFSRTFQGPH